MIQMGATVQFPGPHNLVSAGELSDLRKSVAFYDQGYDRLRRYECRRAALIRSYPMTGQDQGQAMARTSWRRRYGHPAIEASQPPFIRLRAGAKFANPGGRQIKDIDDNQRPHRDQQDD
jgi:hypothetical protein